MIHVLVLCVFDLTFDPLTLMLNYQWSSLFLAKI